MVGQLIDNKVRNSLWPVMFCQTSLRLMYKGCTAVDVRVCLTFKK